MKEKYKAFLYSFIHGLLDVRENRSGSLFLLLFFKTSRINEGKSSDSHLLSVRPPLKSSRSAA